MLFNSEQRNAHDAKSDRICPLNGNLHHDHLQPQARLNSATDGRCGIEPANMVEKPYEDSLGSNTTGLFRPSTSMKQKEETFLLGMKFGFEIDDMLAADTWL